MDREDIKEFVSNKSRKAGRFGNFFNWLIPCDGNPIFGQRVMLFPSVLLDQRCWATDCLLLDLSQVGWDFDQMQRCVVSSRAELGQDSRHIGRQCSSSGTKLYDPEWIGRPDSVPFVDEPDGKKLAKDLTDFGRSCKMSFWSKDILIHVNTLFDGQVSFFTIISWVLTATGWVKTNFMYSEMVIGPEILIRWINCFKRADLGSRGIRLSDPLLLLLSWLTAVAADDDVFRVGWHVDTVLDDHKHGETAATLGLLIRFKPVQHLVPMIRVTVSMIWNLLQTVLKQIVSFMSTWFGHDVMSLSMK